MAFIISEVVSVVAASDWHFGDSIMDNDKRLADLEPVVCFAMVRTVMPEHLSAPPGKQMIPLKTDEYGELDDLIGRDVSEYSRDIIHASQVVGPDPDDV
ncbi:hypothetical protein IMCC20628_03084 [Hoeflea sp. IMCC20628]|uniref:hypothetical protein n=1 Tax=Hoeflea sp. IMCC20628 TaxID=1620421 RepID=UPI00063AF1D2|nr:hypothetical protein [Hoeflea sp. IMCC20628]AKI01777.1 hypothetical protein IMCC20628_03084 [Hoeflea sp. IMCC20628]